VARSLLVAIRAVARDFDGVMTDDKVVVDEHGTEAVVCSRRDGLGIAHLREAGVHVAVFSTERNPVVQQRCRKLGVECHQDLTDKETAVLAWLRALDLTAGQLAFLGNDVNDLACLRLATLSVVPADAHPDVLGEVGLVLTRPGGDGAVRELADLILEAR
jgi:N-acylneuraminate cytidylyltransferase